ncbi:MAG TPA: TonB-dependent receptor [Vicinamibacterales bacterium]|nr:TonB-dependent receptor [Vicinamibacterales bacterium]
MQLQRQLRVSLGSLLLVMAGGPVTFAFQATQVPAPQSGQTTAQTPPPAQGQTPPPQTPPQQTPPPQTPPTPPAEYKETVVVSASKIEQQLVDAPATMTVIGARELSVAPSGGYGDLLRNVPGLNITQISARDINVTSRGATSSLATSQLAVLDGRSIYQDFFGFVMWDFMPADLDEIKRIEVIRGPASAVWGANALNGVINVLTKSPREMAGSNFTIGVGALDREVNNDGAESGQIFYVRGSHAAAVNDRWAYKISAGSYFSDALARPTGAIPNGTGTQYPTYTNNGTLQPKLDARFDYDFADTTRKLQFAAGVGGTDGVMHTGIGPFDIDRGATMGYWKVNYAKNALRVQAFMNFLNGNATNLVSVTPAAQPIALNFDTKTFDIELGDTRLVQNKHVFTYGGNLRFNHFDLTIAPDEHSRTEGGAYVQDEFMLSTMYRIVAGARVDKFSSIDNAVFSPRVALVVKPKPEQSVRVSYNRAFRAPSMINNNLKTTIGTPLPLGAIHPSFAPLGTYYVPTDAIGNKDLTQEHIDMVEVAYTATIRNRASISAAWYYSKFAEQIFFTNILDGVTQIWGPAPPPPGWPLPAAVWAQLYQNGIIFPKTYSYDNLGTVKSKGLELGLDGLIRNNWTGFINYSFQADPIPEFPGLTEAQALAEINIPAKHLFNTGVTYTSPSWYGTLAVSHSDKAYWQDVLDSRYSGYTDPYTSVNMTVGAKFGGHYSAALKIGNLGNTKIQQHIFGDIVKRTIVGEFKVNLPR